ncbi:MAG TPA: hypothetical protein PLE78_01645 [Flavobacteriales bacterium]|nr:hypothetical protein [Flavobacteriales bacterium]
MALSFSAVCGQDDAFRRGWENGYKQGWCYGVDFGCIEPVVPYCPYPAYGEEGYTAGYNRGFVQGKQTKESSMNDSTEPVQPARFVIPYDDIIKANETAAERRREKESRDQKRMQKSVDESRMELERILRAAEQHKREVELNADPPK